MELRKEYLHLRRKFSFQPISGHLWKFLRLRPANFPTIRIAELASILQQNTGLFSKVMETRRSQDINDLLAAETSPYWDTHYIFGKESKVQKKCLGEDAIRLMMINLVVLFLFLYGKVKDQPDLQRRAIQLLQSLPEEKNRVTSNFSKYGIDPQNALESQALLELKSQFCDGKKCLHCRIGLDLIK